MFEFMNKNGEMYINIQQIRISSTCESNMTMRGEKHLFILFFRFLSSTGAAEEMKENE